MASNIANTMSHYYRFFAEHPALMGAACLILAVAGAVLVGVMIAAAGFVEEVESRD